MAHVEGSWILPQWSCYCGALIAINGDRGHLLEGLRPAIDMGQCPAADAKAAAWNREIDLRDLQRSSCSTS